MANILKQNDALLKEGKKVKVKVSALKRELGKAQKALENARFKLAKLDALHRKMDDLKGKVGGLKAQVGELTTKVPEAKKIGVAKFKESNAYKLTQFLYKKRVKIIRLL